MARRLEVIAFRLEAVVLRLGAIAIIAFWLEAITIRLEAIAIGWTPSLLAGGHRY